MKLIPSNEAINIVEYGLLSLRQTTQGIRKSLGQDIRKDKIREAEKKKLNVQQFDAVKKKDAEKIVEAKQSNNFIKGGVSKIMRGAKSIFQGLLSAAGWILLDYLVAKLPEIIAIVNKVTRIVQKLWDAVQQTWSNIQSTFKEIKDVFRQFSENIKNWDFLDIEGKLRKEFDEFKDSADKLNSDLGNSLNDIGKELTNLGNISQEELRQAKEQLGITPKPTTPMIPPDLTLPPTPPAETRTAPEETVVPPGKTKATKETPLSVLVSDPINSSGTRLVYDVTNDEFSRFGPEDYEKILLLVQQGKANITYRSAQEVRDAVADRRKSRPQTQPPKAKVEPTTPKLPPLETKTYPGQYYGAPRQGGKRKHAGTDFEITGNEEFYSRIGGVVIYARNAGGHYGNVVEVYNAEMGVTERIAEAREILVKEGDVVRAGQPVVRGEDLKPDGSPRTGVIHYEVRKGKANASGEFEGTLDPVKFLRDLGQEVKERYPNIGMANMNKYASIFESPNGGKLNTYELAQEPEVIPFDIAMVLNSETTSGTLTETGTGAITLAALENAPELPSGEFENVRQVIMAMAKINREG